MAMKLISHSMGLAFHHYILTCQVRARGCILPLDCILDACYEKRVSFVRPNPKFGAKLAIIRKNEPF